MQIRSQSVSLLPSPSLPPLVVSHPRLPSLFATLCKVFCTRMRARPHGNPRRVSLVARPWACNVTRVQVLARVIQRHLNSSGYIVTLVLFYFILFFFFVRSRGFPQRFCRRSIRNAISNQLMNTDIERVDKENLNPSLISNTAACMNMF